MKPEDILQQIEETTEYSLGLEEKSMVFAAVVDIMNNTRLASSSLKSTIINVVNDLNAGNYKIASQEIGKDIFQDFSIENEIPEPFSIINKKEVDEFLDKMAESDTEKANYFNDTWEFYHPTDVFEPENLPKKRYDFSPNNVG